MHIIRMSNEFKLNSIELTPPTIRSSNQPSELLTASALTFYTFPYFNNITYSRAPMSVRILLNLLRWVLRFTEGLQFTFGLLSRVERIFWTTYSLFIILDMNTYMFICTCMIPQLCKNGSVFFYLQNFLNKSFEKSMNHSHSSRFFVPEWLRFYTLFQRSTNAANCCPSLEGCSAHICFGLAFSPTLDQKQTSTTVARDVPFRTPLRLGATLTTDVATSVPVSALGHVGSGP